METKMKFDTIEEMMDFIKSIQSGDNRDYSKVELIETVTLKKFNGDNSIDVVEELIATNVTKIL